MSYIFPNAKAFNITVLFAVLATGIAFAADMRTWTDATGKNKIKGKFVSVDEGKVTIEKADGSEVEIELKKLSKEDQKYVADQQKNDDPFKAKSDDPFKSKSSKEMPAKGGGSDGEIVIPDYSNAKTVLVSRPEEGWKFEIPEETKPQTRPKAKLIPIPKKTDFFEGAKGFAGSQNGKYAAVSYTLQRPGVNQPITSRVVICDLEKNKSVAEASTNGGFIVLGMHNDGKRILVKKEEFGSGNSNRLELWNVGAKSISKIAQWLPYDEAQGGDRDIKSGGFVGDDKMVSMSAGGKLVVWSIENITPEIVVNAQGGCIPGVSPNGKWIAFSTGKAVAVLGVAEAEIVAMQNIPQVQWPVLSFSPGMKRLGMAAFDRLYVWDFDSGELYREMPYQGMHVMGDITWPSDDHVLLGKRYLVDLENQVKLWDYTGGEHVQQFGGITWFQVSDGERKPGALLGAQLPPPAVKDELTKALSKPDFFVLKPGTVVKVDVSGVDPAGKEYVEKALTNRLKDAGFDVNPSGTITALAQTEVGPDRQINYRTFGRLGGETLTVRDYFVRLKFVYNGQDVWQTQAGSVPHFVRLAQNETIGEHLKKSEKFNFDWFGRIEVPKLLQKPSPGDPNSKNVFNIQTVGQTRLTAQGPQ